MAGGSKTLAPSAGGTKTLAAVEMGCVGAEKGARVSGEVRGCGEGARVSGEVREAAAAGRRGKGWAA